jgi:hypothetical protein
MKRILVNSFLLTGLLFLVNITYAQKKTSTPAERAGKLTEWMKTNLQLNDDQVTQVQKINLNYANKPRVTNSINVEEGKNADFARE